MTHPISTSLDALRHGFHENDCKLAIRELVESWSKNIGRVDDEPLRGPENVRFESSITGIRLRGMGEVPVLIAGEDSQALRAAIGSLVRQTASGRVIGIILCATESAYRYLRTTSVIPRKRFLVLSRGDARKVLTDDVPIEKLRQMLIRRIPYRRLVPFSVSEPTQGLLFVGRANEIDMLVEENQDFALCGPGGIGKTSLLKQALRHLRRDRNPRYDRIVEVDLIASPVDLNAAARAIAKAIQPTKRAFELTNFSQLGAFLKHQKATDSRFRDGPIDLFIDEIDSILKLDGDSCDETGKSYPLMRTLRHARNLRRVRLTISGRTETESLLGRSDNPFLIDAHYGSGKHMEVSRQSRLKLLKLEELREEEARDLLLGPLRDLGYPVDEEGDALLERLRECKGIPFHVQNLGLDIANEAARSTTPLGLAT